MTVLNRYVWRSCVRDVKEFLDECERSGEVCKKSIRKAQNWSRNGLNGSGGVSEIIGIDLSCKINSPEEREKRGGYSIIYFKDEWEIVRTPDMKLYNTIETQKEEASQESSQQGASQQGELPMSLREYYVGEWMKAAISNDNRILTSDYPESKADKIVSLVDAVIARMGRE